jgi:hypothetical protein
MKFKKIQYKDLNSKQKENYNFQRLAAVLADYGYNCIRLSDDAHGPDFLAYHIKGEDILKVQLKSSLVIDKKYRDQNIWVAFPSKEKSKEKWHLILHDKLVELAGTIEPNPLETKSWK